MQTLLGTLSQNKKSWMQTQKSKSWKQKPQNPRLKASLFWHLALSRLVIREFVNAYRLALAADSLETIRLCASALEEAVDLYEKFSHMSRV